MDVHQLQRYDIIIIFIYHRLCKVHIVYIKVLLWLINIIHYKDWANDYEGEIFFFHKIYTSKISYTFVPKEMCIEYTTL